jgi:hypothetical protein
MELIDVTDQRVHFHTGLRPRWWGPSWIIPQVTDSYYGAYGSGEAEIRAPKRTESLGHSEGEREGFQWNS